MDSTTIDVVTRALQKAWLLGQTYWQQADSEYISQNKKTEVTLERFQKLVDDTLSAVRDTPPPPIRITEGMLSRFLTWRLPEDFAPDGGISFTSVNYPGHWPTGTNLLTYHQARTMLEHVLNSPEDMECD